MRDSLTVFDKLVELEEKLVALRVTGQLVVDFKNGFPRWHLPKMDILYDLTATEIGAVVTVRKMREA